MEFPEVGYGLRLKRSVEERELVMTVPVSMMITGRTARQGPLGAFIAQEPLLTAMPNLALAVHLLNERYTADSQWKPYISECITALVYLLITRPFLLLLFLPPQMYYLTHSVFHCSSAKRNWRRCSHLQHCVSPPPPPPPPPPPRFV